MIPPVGPGRARSARPAELVPGESLELVEQVWISGISSEVEGCGPCRSVEAPADLVLGVQDLAVGVSSCSGERLVGSCLRRRRTRRSARPDLLGSSSASASAAGERGLSGGFPDDPIRFGLSRLRAGRGAPARARLAGSSRRSRGRRHCGHGITTVRTRRSGSRGLHRSSLPRVGGEDDEADIGVQLGPGGGRPRRLRPPESPDAGQVRSPPFRGWRRSPQRCSYVAQDQHGDDQPVDGDAFGEADHDHRPAEQVGLLADGGQGRRSGVGDGDTSADRGRRRRR